MTGVSGDSFQELSMEYNNLHATMNSLGVQAIVGRMVQAQGGTAGNDQNFAQAIAVADYEFIQGVAEGCRQVLQNVVKISKEGSLRFHPTRLFHRVIAASVLLLKMMGLGAHVTTLKASLTILEEVIHALSSEGFDDMHVAPSYAPLLHHYMVKFRQCLVPSAAPRGLAPSREWQDSSWVSRIDTSIPGDHRVSGNSHNVSDDWMALPFSASLAPFRICGDSLEITGFDEKAWGFLRT
jgi:hypothetical protein